MAFANKKELMYLGILTAIFLIIVLILSMTLPLNKIIDENKDVNNMNPIYDQNNLDLIKKLAEDQNKAYLECVKLCEESKSLDNYSDGPCLSDAVGFKIKDWACDIAHNPRIEIDNDPKNQCKTILNGTANRFVELDENCAIIR